MLKKYIMLIARPMEAMGTQYEHRLFCLHNVFIRIVFTTKTLESGARQHTHVQFVLTICRWRWPYALLLISRVANKVKHPWTRSWEHLGIFWCVVSHDGQVP